MTRVPPPEVSDVPPAFPAASPETPPPAGLMQSLNRLVRGLSALFWGLPLALVVSVQTARTTLLAGLGVLPPLLANGLLLYALTQLGHFQRGERIWQRARERCLVLALLNLGLSPFLYWWKMMPQVLHFQFTVTVLALSGLMLLFSVNQLLQRLAAMLPDETLRLEARLFTTLNLGLLVATAVLGAGWVGFSAWGTLPDAWLPLLELGRRLGVLLVLLMTLLPLALTMALIWKIKETILASVFASV